MPKRAANAGRPQIVRIVVDGWTWQRGEEDNVAHARRLLVKALKREDWPRPSGFRCHAGRIR